MCYYPVSIVPIHMMLLYSYMSALVLDGKTSSSLLIVLDDVDKHLRMIL